MSDVWRDMPFVYGLCEQSDADEHCPDNRYEPESDTHSMRQPKVAGQGFPAHVHVHGEREGHEDAGIGPRCRMLWEQGVDTGDEQERQARYPFENEVPLLSAAWRPFGIVQHLPACHDAQ